MHKHILAPCFCGLLLCATGLTRAGTLSVTLLDEHGSPTAARVYLTDAAGKSWFAPDTIVYDKTRAGFSVSQACSARFIWAA